jgi:hypothetical protein
LVPASRKEESFATSFSILELSLIERFKNAQQKEECMLDILQLRVHLDDFDQLRRCQIAPPDDCHAAFTVRGAGTVWPVASWGETPATQKINVRGWFPLLDQMADEFLIWRPQGGCFFVDRDKATYRVAENDPRSVLFLQFELNRLTVVPPQPARPQQVYSAR